MVSAELSHNPYLLSTKVLFNGQAPKINSQIEKYEKLPLKDWVHMVPEIFYNEMNGYDFNLYFIGTRPDYEEVKNSFLSKGIGKDEVRLIYKNEIEDADTKSREVDTLISWLKDTPNHKFDFESFWSDNADLFEGAYPLIMIRGSLPSNTDSLLAIEMVENASELKNTELTSTPIIFYIDEETKSQFRKDLNIIVNRQDIRKEQLFFKISPLMDQAQVTRVICDLGVEKPHVIDNYNDDSVMMFIRNYPVTEFVRKAIQLFRVETEKISEVLRVENRVSIIANAEIYKKIETLENELLLLKQADEFFEQRDNYESPYVFNELKRELIEKILKWKSRKTKIVGEDEIESTANAYIKMIESAVNTFISSMEAAYISEWENICKKFAEIYEKPGIDITYSPANFNMPSVHPVTIPEIKAELLKLTTYEETKNDFFGFFKKPNETNKPEKVATCYLEQWRYTVQNIITPDLHQYFNHNIQNLSECYDMLAKSYHQHLVQLIDVKTKDKEMVTAQLSDDEKKLQEDNDWLSVFKEQLQAIERN